MQRNNSIVRRIPPENADQKANVVSQAQNSLFFSNRTPEQRLAAIGFPFEKIPDYFCCHISQSLMKNPVLLVGEGRTYDRENIEKYLEESGGKGVHINRTLNEMERMLIPNKGVLSDIEIFVLQQEIKQKEKFVYEPVRNISQLNRSNIDLDYEQISMQLKKIRKVIRLIDPYSKEKSMAITFLFGVLMACLAYFWSSQNKIGKHSPIIFALIGFLWGSIPFYLFYNNKNHLGRAHGIEPADVEFVRNTIIEIFGHENFLSAKELIAELRVKEEHLRQKQVFVRTPEQRLKAIGFPLDQVPQYLCCSLNKTKTIMMDPVLCRRDGKTYERANIEKYLKESGDKIPKEDQLLIPNIDIRSFIESFVSDQEKNKKPVEQVTYKP